MSQKRTIKSTASEGSQSILRALDVLKFLSSRSADPATATEVAQHCKLTKPTCHRILSALVAEGFAAVNAEKRTYHLGIESYSLGVSASHHFNLGYFAAASLNRIAQITRDTCYLTVRSGNESVCIGRENGDFPVKILTLDVGHRRPLGVGAGSLAILASMTDQEITQLFSDYNHVLAPYREFTVAALKEQLQESRHQGYAVNAGKILPEMSAIGVSIISHQGKTLGALSVAALTSRLSGEHKTQVVNILQKEARIIADTFQASMQSHQN